jgi:hypothetical protein
MAGRGRPTFQKRLKEQKRQEKRREKLERKLERREEKSGDPTAGSGPEIDWEAAEEFDLAEALEEFAEVQADQ